MTFEIEKDVPVTTQQSRFDVLPLGIMEINNSTFVPESFATRNSITNYISHYNRKNNTVRFTTASANKNNENGTRIFRIK